MTETIQFQDLPHIQTILKVGKDALNDLNTDLQNDVFNKVKSTLIVTGKGSARISGALDDVMKILTQNNIQYFVFDDIEPNPSIETVDACIAAYKDKKVDLIIAIGGGSPMDASKAINMGMCGVEYMVKQEKLPVLKPLVCIPTCFGTGSEVTQYAMVNSNTEFIKKLVPNFLHPTRSYVNPLYMKSLPDLQVHSTYFDMTCHALESSLHKKSTQQQLEYALKALDCLKRGRSVLAGNRDYNTLLLMAKAAIYAGISISLTATTIPHGISYFLTYKYDIPHGFAAVMTEYAFMHKLCDQDRVNKLMNAYGISIGEFKLLVQQYLPKNLPVISKEEKVEYIEKLIKSGKCNTFNENITVDEILSIWE